MLGKLFVIATPIGNLEDITPRALRTISAVDLLLCEDTRVTRKLLSRYDISVRLESYREQVHGKMLGRVLDRLRRGHDVGLVSDAGMPGISDPGGRLVDALIAAEPEIPIVPIPGPSAVTAAVAVSGFPAAGFIFLGFPPHKKGRRAFFDEALGQRLPAVLYESPHRILKTLESIAGIDPGRRLCLARELTKLHETIYRGTAADIIRRLRDESAVRGEMVLVIEGVRPGRSKREEPQ